MPKLHNLIFPDLLGTWAEVNLNELSKQFITDGGPGILTVEQQEGLMAQLHQSLGVQYSYGGWMEDRSILWNGHYMPSDKMTHLGIDYNVPVNSFVHLPWDGKVVFCTHDEDQNGGWGGRIDFYNSEQEFYFILGHLDPSAAVTSVGRIYQKGLMVGFVGNDKVNGGWFPHLHLQVVSNEEYERYTNPMDIDGYGGDGWEREYPNPEDIV